MSRILWTDTDLRQALGVAVPDHLQITGISIDSRMIKTGDLFVALTGEYHDGHAFVDTALQQATAALVSQPSTDPHCIQVADTMQALTRLAQAARARLQGQVIGLTGSVGKTTAKEMLAHVLSRQAETFATYGNLNNHIGVPLTLARMPASSRYAVIEMGMNHAGEMTPLTQISKPHVAMITTIAPVHIGNFSNGLDGIADAKAEILSGLTTDGIAVLPADSPYLPMLQQRSPRFVTFGTHDTAMYRLVDHTTTQDGITATLTLAGKPCTLRLSMPHPALLYNALGVLACVDAVGADVARAVHDLASYTPIYGRGKIHTFNIKNGTFKVLDETYNASPQAMAAALATLANLQPFGRRIAVLGDMFELGEHTPALHEALKNPLQAHKIDAVYLAGTAMAGLKATLPNTLPCVHAADAASLLPALLADLQAGDMLMIKGSAGMKMSVILQELKDRFTESELKN